MLQNSHKILSVQDGTKVQSTKVKNVEKLTKIKFIVQCTKMEYLEFTSMKIEIIRSLSNLTLIQLKNNHYTADGNTRMRRRCFLEFMCPLKSDKLVVVTLQTPHW